MALHGAQRTNFQWDHVAAGACRRERSIARLPWGSQTATFDGIQFAAAGCTECALTDVCFVPGTAIGFPTTNSSVQVGAGKSTSNHYYILLGNKKLPVSVESLGSLWWRSTSGAPARDLIRGQKDIGPQADSLLGGRSEKCRRYLRGLVRRSAVLLRSSHLPRPNHFLTN
jgi:hypothetical protein